MGLFQSCPPRFFSYSAKEVLPASGTVEMMFWHQLIYGYVHLGAECIEYIECVYKSFSAARPAPLCQHRESSSLLVGPGNCAYLSPSGMKRKLMVQRFLSLYELVQSCGQNWFSHLNSWETEKPGGVLTHQCIHLSRYLILLREANLWSQSPPEVIKVENIHQTVPLGVAQNKKAVLELLTFCF